MILLERELSSLAKIGDGAHASLKRINKGIPYLTAKNISKSGIDYKNINYISEETYNKYFKDTSNALTQPKKDDILYSIIGSIGAVYVVRDEKIGISSSVAILRADKSKILPEYLAYYMNGPVFDTNIQAVRGGVAQGFMSLAKLGSIIIKYPKDITYQKKIVDILSTYDNLIENNQKQIKLLEEAAQRLYKEWFIDLRFPGHESVENVDGAPEGWSYKALKEISTLKAGGDKPRKFSKTLDREHFIPVYSNGTVDDGLYGYTDSAEIIDDSITISARGSVGYTCIRREPYVPIVRLISIIPRTIDVIYLFLYLKNKSFDSNGAAQQQLTIPMVRDFKVLIPSKEVLILFLEVMNPIFDKIDILKQQLMGLTEARDRLLPKLMSGKIEV